GCAASIVNRMAMSATRRDHACVGILVEQLLNERLEIDDGLLRHALMGDAPAFTDRPTRYPIEALESRHRVQEASCVFFPERPIDQRPRLIEEIREMFGEEVLDRLAQLLPIDAQPRAEISDLGSSEMLAEHAADRGLTDAEAVGDFLVCQATRLELHHS